MPNVKVKKLDCHGVKFTGQMNAFPLYLFACGINCDTEMDLSEIEIQNAMFEKLKVGTNDIGVERLIARNIVFPYEVHGFDTPMFSANSEGYELCDMTGCEFPGVYSLYGTTKADGSPVVDENGNPITGNHYSLPWVITSVTVEYIILKGWKFPNLQVIQVGPYGPPFISGGLAGTTIRKFDFSDVDLNGAYFNNQGTGPFSGTYFEEIDISGTDLSGFVGCPKMFNNSTNLKKVSLAGVAFSSSVTNFEDMFKDCYNLETVDLTGVDTSYITNMAGMFSGCSALKTIYDDNGTFDVSNVTSDEGMFNVCGLLVGDQGTAFRNVHVKDKTYAHLDGGASNPGYFSRYPGSEQPAKGGGGNNDEQVSIPIYKGGSRGTGGGSGGGTGGGSGGGMAPGKSSSLLGGPATGEVLRPGTMKDVLDLSGQVPHSYVAMSSNNPLVTLNNITFDNNNKMFLSESYQPLSSTWVGIKDVVDGVEKKYWVYCGQDGKIATGFVTLGNWVYYFDERGIMATGNVVIGDKVYSFIDTPNADEGKCIGFKDIIK